MLPVTAIGFVILLAGFWISRARVFILGAVITFTGILIGIYSWSQDGRIVFIVIAAAGLVLAIVGKLSKEFAIMNVGIGTLAIVAVIEIFILQNSLNH